MTMCVSALALTSLDSVARIGRMSFQELFLGDTTDTSKMPVWQKILDKQVFRNSGNTVLWISSLTLGGYTNVWPLFGSANQMLAALVLIGVAVFLKATNRKHAMLYPPMLIMLAVTFTAIVLNVIGNVQKFQAGTATFLVEGLQLIVAVFLIVLGIIVAITCIKKLVNMKKENAEKAEA